MFQNNRLHLLYSLQGFFYSSNIFCIDNASLVPPISGYESHGIVVCKKANNIFNFLIFHVNIIRNIHYQTIKNNTHNILKKIFQMNIQTESKRKLMTNVMSTDDPVLIEFFSTFISKCFTHRDQSLPTGNTNK